MSDATRAQPEHFSIEENLRLEALNNAVRHRLKDEDADTVVEAAKKYYAFLKGE